MKNTTKSLTGILITIFIFLISIVITKLIKIPVEFIPSSFISHSIQLVLSVLLIYYFSSKGLLVFKIKPIKIRHLFVAILTAIVAFVAVNILATIVFKILHISLLGTINPFLNFSPIQGFLFLFIYASIAEELLFRGFLLNMLTSYTANGIRLFKIKISISAIISGVLFGLTHLVLLYTGASVAFVLRIVLLTTTIGIIAGYYQEKYENNTLVAIVVHMTINSIALIGLILNLLLRSN